MDTALVLDDAGEEMKRHTYGDHSRPAAPDGSGWVMGQANAANEAALQAAARIRARQFNMVEGILGIGQDLISVRSKLGRGKFGAWVASSFDWSARTAANYMRLAEVFGNRRELVAQLPLTMLYELAAKSTPRHVREDIIVEIRGGSVPNSKSVKERIRAAKQARTHLGRDGGRKARKADPTSIVLIHEGKQPEAPSGETARLDVELFGEAAKRAVCILQRRLRPEFARFARALQKIPPAVFLAALRDATGGGTGDASRTQKTS